jgi:transposase
MAREDIIMVRQRELKRLHVIRKVLEGALAQTEAAELVSLTERQIRRIVKRIREEGDEGIRHKSRGRPSNRKLPFKQRIVQLYRSSYPDFGPTLFTERLEEREGIAVSLRDGAHLAHGRGRMEEAPQTEGPPAVARKKGPLRRDAPDGRFPS